jgi:citrate synthase
MECCSRPARPRPSRRPSRTCSARQEVPGFGHRVYKTFDPRATFLRKMSKQLGEAAKNTKWYEMSERIIPVVRA